VGEVNCLYCGKSLSDEAATCAACGAPSHFQKQGFRLGGRRRFLLFFVMLSLACLLIALWLPR